MTVKYSSVKFIGVLDDVKQRENSQHRHVLISFLIQPTQVLGIYSSISISCPGITVKYSSVKSIGV